MAGRPDQFIHGTDHVIIYYGSDADNVRKMMEWQARQNLAAMKLVSANKHVIVEVTSKRQAEMAARAGATCVLVTCRPVPGSVNRMPDPAIVREIKQSVTIPVMARVRVGHFVEAQILQSIGIDCIDESEVLSVADDVHFINKQKLLGPFVCGCRDLGEMLRRAVEGAKFIRIQGDVASSGGDVMDTVSTVKRVMAEFKVLTSMHLDEVLAFSKKIQAPYSLLKQSMLDRRVPVVQFASGGISMPADAALMIRLGCDGVFVALDVFDHVNPPKSIAAIVKAVNHCNDPVVIAEVTTALEVADARLNTQEPGDSSRPREAGDSSRHGEAEDDSSRPGETDGSSRPGEADGSSTPGELDHRAVD